MTFRQDINALRALAVVLVLLFHFSLFGVDGGYIGVDIFFVLSGFLMTAIILRGPSEFSFTKFYAARVKRILPAIISLCIVVLGAGWFFIPPSDYAALGWHAASTAGFFSNIVYKDEAGYFDSPSQFKWLLHSWSLSVEWQFYLLYPLLLAPLHKFKPRAIAPFLIGLTVISLAGSAYLSYLKPEFAFFYLPTRIWEMTLGGLAFLAVQKNMVRTPTRTGWIEAAGLALILLAAFIYSNNTPWPSFYAILPVGATLLFLLYTKDSQSWWITAKPVQAIGSWSYSIYLWHWPVVVGLSYWDQQVSGAAKAGGIALSILLGFASYTLIEKPLRDRLSHIAPSRVIIGGVLIVALFIAAGAVIKNQQAVPQRFEGNERLEKAMQGAVKNKPVQNKENPSFIMIGDSHAGSLFGVVEAAMGEDSRGGLLKTHQCATIFDAEMKTKGRGNDCTGFHEKLIARINQSAPDMKLVIANRYSAAIHGPNEKTDINFGLIYNDNALNQRDPHAVYAEQLVKSVCMLARLRPTYIVRPTPEVILDVPAYLARRAIIGARQIDVTYPRATYNARHKVVNAAITRVGEACDVTIIDPAPVLCDSEFCHGSKNGVPYYSDDDHLNDAGRALLVPVFEAVF